MTFQCNKFKVVVWGDSIAGMTPEPWPEKMNSSFNACLADSCKIEVVNSGICGIPACDAKDNFVRDVAEHKPDLVIIQFGFNDMRYCGRRKNLPLSTPEEFEEHIFEMIQKCKSVDSEVLVVGNHAPISYLILPGAISRSEAVTNYNQAAFRAAKRCTVDFFDIQAIELKWLAPEEMVIDDGVHLSERGKMVYSHHMCNYIYNLIKSKGL